MTTSRFWIRSAFALALGFFKGDGRDVPDQQHADPDNFGLASSRATLRLVPFAHRRPPQPSLATSRHPARSDRDRPGNTVAAPDGAAAMPEPAAPTGPSAASSAVAFACGAR